MQVQDFWYGGTIEDSVFRGMNPAKKNSLGHAEKNVTYNIRNWQQGILAVKHKITIPE